MNKIKQPTDGQSDAGACSVSSYPNWTPRVKKILMLTVKATKNYRQSYVGSEHLLAGILMEKEGFAAHVLESHGVTMDYLIAECGWQTQAELIEAQERAEYERLRAKFDPQNANVDATRGPQTTHE